jgi:hypothetical protein
MEKNRANSVNQFKIDEMKNAKTIFAFKLSDWTINIVLIAWFVFQKYWTDFDIMINAYFIVGGWQVISMVTHALSNWYVRKYNARYIYHWITFISVITMPAGSFWILGVTAPFMALFYTFLCSIELYKAYRTYIAGIK